MQCQVATLGRGGGGLDWSKSLNQIRTSLFVGAQQKPLPNKDVTFSVLDRETFTKYGHHLFGAGKGSLYQIRPSPSGAGRERDL